MIRSLVLSLIAVGLFFFSQHGQATTKKDEASYHDKPAVIIFGVVPQQAANVLANVWVPLTQYLSAETGLTIRFATAKNIPNFEQRLSENAYHIAYMNPFHYVYFSKKHGFDAIAKQSNKRIKGIIVAPKDSDVYELEDLQGATLAFPAPASFAATLLPKAELAQNEIQFSSRYVSSHDSVYLNVSKGFFPAGGGVMRTFNNMPAAVRDKLKIVWTTQPYTPHAIAVANDFPAEHRIAIQKALENLHLSEKGKQILQNLGMDGFDAATDTDWNDVRDLNISKEHVRTK